MRSLHDARGEYRSAKRRLARYVRAHARNDNEKKFSSGGLYLMLHGPSGEDDAYDDLFYRFMEKQGIYADTSLRVRARSFRSRQ